jgi:hypothetical protein
MSCRDGASMSFIIISRRLSEQTGLRRRNQIFVRTVFYRFVGIYMVVWWSGGYENRLLSSEDVRCRPF